MENFHKKFIILALMDYAIWFAIGFATARMIK